MIIDKTICSHQNTWVTLQSIFTRPYSSTVVVSLDSMTNLTVILPDDVRKTGFPLK